VIKTRFNNRSLVPGLVGVLCRKGPLFENIHKAKNAEELQAMLPYNLDTAALDAS
jgi:hypothetical protein